MTTNPDPVLGTAEHATKLTAGRHPTVQDALQWLTFAHLPNDLRRFSRPFYQTAVELVVQCADGPELTHALNGLITAKDWATRAGIRTGTGRAGSIPRPVEVVNPPRLVDYTKHP